MWHGRASQTKEVGRAVALGGEVSRSPSWAIMGGSGPAEKLTLGTARSSQAWMGFGPYREGPGSFSELQARGW